MPDPIAATPPADPSPTPPPPPGDSLLPDEELFQRSRAEVQLLLEYVSGRADTSYRPSPAATAEEQRRFKEEFDEVAKICFGPPRPRPSDRRPRPSCWPSATG